MLEFSNVGYAPGVGVSDIFYLSPFSPSPFYGERDKVSKVMRIEISEKVIFAGLSYCYLLPTA